MVKYVDHMFFLLNYMSYYFIEDKTNLKERVSVGFKLHLIMLIIGFPLGIGVTAIKVITKQMQI